MRWDFIRFIITVAVLGFVLILGLQVKKYLDDYDRAGLPGCPNGRVRGPGTGGQCCWEGQSWTGGSCVGRPSDCPNDFQIDESGTGCKKICSGGQATIADGLHCCWPGQRFVSTKNSCAGPPICPAGYQVSGENCVMADWARLKAGKYPMGCVPLDEQCDEDEKPRHTVTISRDFLIMRHEVTHRQFREYGLRTGVSLPAQPAWNSREDHPVVNVTWGEARDFCRDLGGRLPTEAEWEYAARNGGVSGEYWKDHIFPWGSNDQTGNVANGAGIQDRDQWAATAPVGSFPSQPEYGAKLADMSGNVWEWVHDGYDEHYYRSSPERDPVGPADAEKKVARGGSWHVGSRYLRSSSRFRQGPLARDYEIGFRCVLPAP